MKDSNAVYIFYESLLAAFGSRLQTNRSSTAGCVQSFMSNLTGTVTWPERSQVEHSNGSFVSSLQVELLEISITSGSPLVANLLTKRWNVPLGFVLVT